MAVLLLKDGRMLIGLAAAEFEHPVWDVRS